MNNPSVLDYTTGTTALHALALISFLLMEKNK